MTATKTTAASKDNGKKKNDGSAYRIKRLQNGSHVVVDADGGDVSREFGTKREAEAALKSIETTAQATKDAKKAEKETK